MKIGEGDKKSHWTITEMAELSGYDAMTLRYYERIGIIEPVSRVNGRRAYCEDDLHRISTLTCLKKTGLSLGEIKDYVNLINQGEKTIPQRLSMILKQQKVVARQIKELYNHAEHIAFKVWYYETALKEGQASLGTCDEAIERYRKETRGRSKFDLFPERSAK